MNAPSLMLILATCAQLADNPADTSPGRNAALSGLKGRIIAKNDLRIPAEVEGLLVRVPVRQGSLVLKGQLLATIDDRQALAAVDVAQKTVRAARERADDDIEERYARAAAGVARLDYEMALEANGRNPGSRVFAPIEIEKKKLDWKRADLQIEKAMKDRHLADLEADVKDAELTAAKIALDRRTIAAPYDGQVEEMLFHESEWVNPGDPVLRLVQFDVMYVDCAINSADYDPSELQGRPVTVLVSLARGRTATVQGHVLHASQSVIAAAEGFGQYTVRAEIQNQRVGDFWVVRPGLPAEITIHADQPPVQIADPIEQSAGR